MAVLDPFDTLDDLAAWLDARSELAEEWPSACEFTPVEGENTAPVRRVTPRRPEESAAFGGSLFGADGGQSSGGGSSGTGSLAA